MTRAGHLVVAAVVVKDKVVAGAEVVDRMEPVVGVVDRRAVVGVVDRRAVVGVG
jgi:hypothetical protein